MRGVKSKIRIRERYFRKVIKYPNGAIVHHGDCHIFSAGICTCGLLHDLMPTENPDNIYGEFSEEFEKHETLIQRLKESDE